jgi:hypothetical protein
MERASVNFSTSVEFIGENGGSRRSTSETNRTKTVIRTTPSRMFLTKDPTQALNTAVRDRRHGFSTLGVLR